MKTKKLALLLPILPLLMANSPAPARIRPQKYDDFEASYVGDEINDNYRYQIFHLKNNGTGFISELDISGLEGYEYNTYLSENTFNPIFDDTLIGPGQELDLRVKSTTSLVTIDGSKLIYHSYAYLDSGNSEKTITGDKSVSLVSSYVGGSYTSYSYRINASIEGADSAYRYTILFKLNYDGETIYLKVENDSKLFFYTYEELDLSKLEVIEASRIYEITNTNTYYYSGCTLALAQFLLRILVVFLVVVLVVGSIIFLTIFLPKIIRKNNAKKREKEIKK